MSATCPHLNKENYLQSLQGKLIYKDQCTKCFHDPRDENGLDVCLKCLNGSCISGQNHSLLHFQQHNHPIVLNIKLIERPPQQQEEQQDLTKLAIGKPGGAIANQIEYDEIYTLRCLACNKNLDNQLLDGVIKSIQQENSAFKKQDICEWELDIQPCEHTLTIEQIPKDMTQGLNHCHQCDLSTNLWLCLVCGNVGCGRKNYDGTGGNGHASEHSQKSGHCLVVKLGTITQEGNASLYCYSCDNDVSDAYLSQHLAVFGINISEQKKTEKTIAEMNLDANRNLTLSSIIEAGKKLKPLFGSKFTGMQNLGNSCYINSVFQTLFSIPEFEERFYVHGLEHLKQCKKFPVDCLTCQLSKLGVGLVSGEYSKKKEIRFLSSVDTSAFSEYEKYEQDGVSINDLRAMIGKNHPEFKTKQMQDALEYLQHVFDLIEKEEKNTKQNHIGKIFEFKTVNKLKCMSCGGVKLIENKTNELKLPVLPPTKEQLQQALKEQEERQQKLKKEASSTNEAPKEDAKLLEEPEYNITFEQCIQILQAGDVVELNCSKCGVKSNFTSNHYLKTLPKYLVLPTNRLHLENWVPKKLNAIIQMPSEYNLKDLVFKGLDGDEFLLENQEGNNNNQDQQNQPQVDEIALLQLLEMGFGENRAKRALIKYQNNSEMATNYLFENTEDASLDLPLEPIKAQGKKSGFVVNEENLMILQQMGFDVEQCKRALKKFNNNVELALDGLSQGEYYEEEQEENKDQGMEEEDAPITETNFELQAAIVHIGKSVHSGHYVAYVKRNNEWVYYNDAKVAEAEDPALGKGYIYLFKLK
ncbi:hypothetical protein ABPG74_014974 [Tetrahymena malaccensis]